MSDLLQEGATASVPLGSPPAFSEKVVADHTASQITAREALAIELIRELALRNHRDELIQEVNQMMQNLTRQGLQIFLATSMRYPEYSLLELYEDVISLQLKGDIGDETDMESSDNDR